MKRWIIVALVVFGGASLAWGGYLTSLYLEDEREKRLEALTPDLAMGMYENRNRPGDYCFETGPPDKDGAPRFVWEDVRVKEYRPEGPIVYPVAGMYGEVKENQTFCGFAENGYYDFVYLPTGRAFYIKYPGCGGNPWAGSLDGCGVPSSWPRE